uniref:IclR-ED domain-containing protein n=1 Tax=Solanum lycopersicum TaxID=4081 RepID=A0A494G9W1_SOLLC
MADRDEMVYLESIRYGRKVSLRSVVAGQRVPMALTSLGRAWLAVAPEVEYAARMADFAARAPHWPALRREIESAVAHVRRHGWCAASWQPEVVAISTPLALDHYPVHVLNVSLSTRAAAGDVARELAPRLMRLASDIRDAVQTAQSEPCTRACCMKELAAALQARHQVGTDDALLASFRTISRTAIMGDKTLDGLNVAILVTDGFEQSELQEPRRALDEAGAHTRVVAPKDGEVKGWKLKDWGDTVAVDVQLDAARAEDFDALLLPGGVINP